MKECVTKGKLKGAIRIIVKNYYEFRNYCGSSLTKKLVFFFVKFVHAIIL